MSFEDFKIEFKTIWELSYQEKEPFWLDDDHIYEILYTIWTDFLRQKKFWVGSPSRFHRFVHAHNWLLKDHLPVVIRGLRLRKKSTFVLRLPTIQHLSKEAVHKFEQYLHHHIL